MTLTNVDLTDYISTSRREWLSVNGHGSFASGTIAGAPTRRYHALLVAALRPPVGRMTILSQVHETITVDGMPYDLHTGHYADGTIHPQGWRNLVSFTQLPVPTWRYQLTNRLELTKQIFLAPERNTVYITYTRGTTGNFGDVTLTLQPLTAWKDYHAEMHPWEGFPIRQGFTPDGYESQATADSPTLRLLLRNAKWSRAGWWHRDNFHEREAERGLDCIEHLYCPATATVSLFPGETVTFIGTIESDMPAPAAEILEKITRQQTALFDALELPVEDEIGRALVHTAEQFIARGPGIRTTIMAGYPWFTDWGRDTMIALPGLCLSTHRYDIARDILDAFAGFVSEGMIPNRFPDVGETPDYNTVDATLWFVHACQEYIRATGDMIFRQRIAPTIAGIIAAHEKGTRYGIGVDTGDGLLAAGEPGTQLTWMDVKIGDYVVTPRQGKAVEINALWINALYIAAELCDEAAYHIKAERAVTSFRAKFVRPDGHGLYDVIRPDGSADDAIRPNQIIAAALPHQLLTAEQARATVDIVTRELLTPYGLRTLAPSSPDYRAHYAGDSWNRDTAYHQGTVWPWLLGAYSDARHRVYGDSLTPRILLTHLTDYGFGGIAEVFDGDDPHRPDGCPWQAWSVAEVLRIYLKTRKKSTED